MVYNGNTVEGEMNVAEMDVRGLVNEIELT